jgi:ABC-type glycerol-3-phosphate transport system substrate-binding protein
MFSHRFFRIALLLLTFGLLTGSVIVANAQDDLSGEINVFLQEYYQPDRDADIAAISQSLAQEYMDMHPGVTINLVPNLPVGQDQETYLAARMAAGETPDIMWQQFYSRNTRADDWWVPLNDILEMPNPYIEEGVPGSERWVDSFPAFVMGQTRAADGNWYQVSLDWVETGLYYNREMFEQAGIDPANWTNWSTFVADMQTLKETAGVDPLGLYMQQTGWSNWVWADDIFLTVAWGDMADEFYMEKYNDPNIPWRQLNPEEIAKAIIDGTLNAEDPRMDDYLRISREFVDLLPIDYNGITSLDDLNTLFFSEQVAATWNGTWVARPFSEQVPFDYGITYLPPFTTDDAPGAQGTAYRVGGPSSAGQYGIPQSTLENGNFDLAADFLMFIAAPQNFERLVQAHGGYIPMVAGAEAGEVMEGFADIAALPERLFTDPQGRLTLESGDAWQAAMQAYFLGQTDEAATKAALQQIWMDGALALCAEQAYEWCPA